MGKEALVDDEDYEFILSHGPWHTNESLPGKWYARSQSRVYMHRLLIPDSPQVDHKDGDGLNNCRHNLRRSNARLNQGNRQSLNTNNTSGYHGVHWDTVKQKWKAQIRYKRQTISLGYYHDPVDGAKAYDAAARRFFGEHACQNFGSSKGIASSG